jgi:DNA-binding transcriptional LysR family regulator
VRHSDRSITLQQLHTFLTVANEGSFTASARLLFISEPAVSHQIAALERLVGIRLLERSSGKPVELTKAGLRMFPACKELFECLETVLQEIDAVRRAEDGCVALGARRQFCSYLLPSIYASFREFSPNVSVRLDMGSQQHLIDSLRKRALDLVVLDERLEDPNFRNDELPSAELIMVAPSGHPLASEERVPLSALGSEKLILAGPDSRARKPLEQTAAEAGVVLDTWWESGNLEAQIHSVMSGLGVGPVPLYAVASQLEHGLLAILRVEGFPLPLPWFLVSPMGDISMPASALREHMLRQGP